MINLAQARQNMVDSQIHPAGVVDPVLLQAYETIRREDFVPDQLRNVAYSDEALAIGHGRYFLEPIVHGQMVQAVLPQSHEVVLDIGGGTGYSAAVLSSLASTVVALEDQMEFSDKAAALWQTMDIVNAVSVTGPLSAGVPKEGPYDLIFVNGAVAEVPEPWIAQLSDEGRMIVIVKKEGRTMGSVTLVRRNHAGGYSDYALFEAAAHYLPGFEPRSTFNF